MKDFGGETPYSIMFGPDICGFSTKKVSSQHSHTVTRMPEGSTPMP